ncbi:MAG: hypothetical protein A2W25_01670 [candidate division Zixibacteria bacterium RBG_16_53_22]|nr:MAG: hypothetical protein A2W25_01670 [candidate division Zixibacteria bacterium RBG_16_53_22]
MFWDTFGIWIAALLTIGIVSFLYRDNPVYKFCESLFVGISAGYWFVSLYYQNLLPKLFDNLGITKLLGLSQNDGAFQHIFSGHWDGRIWYVLAGILAIMMLLRLVSKIGWISRWPLAVVVGSTAGLYMITYFQSNFLSQLQNTVIPLVAIERIRALPSAGMTADQFFAAYLGNLVLIVGTLTGLVYFYFSKEHKGALGGAAKIGIYFLMITFGASFGYTVMSRMSLLIGRLYFLFGDWLGIVR